MAENKDEQRREWVGTIANVASVAVAVVALVVAFVAERRSADRFERQLDREEKLTVAQARPLLDIYTIRYDDLKAVRLANRGLGPALITRIEFCKAERCAVGLAQLFDISKWDSYRTFRRSVIRQESEIDLVKLSLANLMGQGLSPEQCAAAFESWRTQKKGIRVRIEYTDIFGNQQPALVRRLR